MTPTYTVADIIALVRDNLRNENLNSTRIIRNLNSAADLVFSLVGHPSLEKVYKFDYDVDTLTYSLPEDYAEPIFLKYTKSRMNRDRSFSYRTPEWMSSKEAHKISKTHRQERYFGVGSDSGAWLLYVLGSNSYAPLYIDSFDSNNATNWITSNDATNVTDDTVIFKEGIGSLNFDVNVALSVANKATLTRTLSGNDFSQFASSGVFKNWFYLPNITNFTSVSFVWGSDSSNYFTSTVTTQADGSAFIVGWNQLQFTYSTAVMTGTPDSTNITFTEFDFNYTAAYTGGTDYRLDYLRLCVLDELDLTYYTRYKGTDSTAVPIYEYTATTDIITIGAFDSIMKNLLALYTTILMAPQYLIDNKDATSQLTLYVSTLKQRYPRKRINNFLAEPKRPNT